MRNLNGRDIYGLFLPHILAARDWLLIIVCAPEAENIRSFMEKWNLNPDNDSYENFTREQQLQMKLENPLCIEFKPQLELNGKPLKTSHGCSVSFNPCLPEGMFQELEAKWALEHYELDASYGWMIFRAAFPWSGRHRPEIKSFSLTMEQSPCCVPGPAFYTTCFR